MALIDMAEKREEKRFTYFHRQCQGFCGSYLSCVRGLDSSRGMQHVQKRASEQENRISELVRSSITVREIAAIIVHGVLRQDKCKTKDEVTEIAIEGLLKDLPCMDSFTDLGEPITSVHVRVILRNVGRKVATLVTFYPLYDDNVLDGIPEVDYENIWS